MEGTGHPARLEIATGGDHLELQRGVSLTFHFAKIG